MADGAQVEGKADKASGGRDKATKPIANAPGGFFEAAPALLPADQAGLASMLAAVDPSRRAAIVLGLQRSHGNAFVQTALSREPSNPSKAARPEARGGYAGIVGGSTEAPSFAVPEGHEALSAGSVSWSKHPDFPGVMGQTYYAHNDIEVWPAYKTKTEKVFRWGIPPWGYETKPEKTNATSGAFKATATPENTEGYKMPNEDPKYPGYEVIIKESATAAKNIAAAEQQHIDDLDTGWAITGVAAKDAINQVADEDAETKEDVAGAKKAAVDKTAAKMGALGPKIRSGLVSEGRLESSLGPMMDKSSSASVAYRDKGKHTIPTPFVKKDDKKKQVILEVDNNFNLDATPSSTVVNLGTIG